MRKKKLTEEEQELLKNLTFTVVPKKSAIIQGSEEKKPDLGDTVL
ncbi:hypothetical protein [Streptococcus chenjunshii]|nr:hypothetical protein [Streptococcus chenjunshii]